MRQRGAGGVWVWREGSARPERVRVHLPLPRPAGSPATRRTRGPCWEPRAALVLGRPPPGGRGCRPERAGLQGSRRGLHPARRFSCGRRREAGEAARRGAPCVRLCGVREAGPAGTRGGRSAAAGLWAGAGPGAASSSAAASASSRCSVSREPRPVDAEPVGSAAASSSRCTAAPREARALRAGCGRAADRARVLCASRCPSPPPIRPSCSLAFLTPSENGSCCRAR